MSTQAVNRVPAGVPEGGRFAPGSSGEAAVRLPGQVSLAEVVDGPPAYLRHEAFAAAASLTDSSDRAVAADLLAPHLDPMTVRRTFAETSRLPVEARPARARALMAEQAAAEFAAGDLQDRAAENRLAYGLRGVEHLPEPVRGTILAGALPHLSPGERERHAARIDDAQARAHRYDVPSDERADLAYQADTDDLDVVDMDEFSDGYGYDFHEVGRALWEGWDAEAHQRATDAVRADGRALEAGPYGVRA